VLHPCCGLHIDIEWKSSPFLVGSNPRTPFAQSDKVIQKD